MGGGQPTWPKRKVSRRQEENTNSKKFQVPNPPKEKSVVSGSYFHCEGVGGGVAFGGGRGRQRKFVKK